MMNITSRQEKMLKAFLRQVDIEVENLPANARAETLADLKTRLNGELRRAGVEKGKSEDESLSDEHFANILSRCKEQYDSFSEVDVSERRWLGVSLVIAERLNISVQLVRSLLVFFGLLTGPFALTAYLAAYGILRATKKSGTPRVKTIPLIKMVGATLGGAVALYLGAVGLLFLFGFLFERFTSEALVLAHWGWLSEYQNVLLFWVLSFLVPISVFAGLPVPNAWDYTAKRIVQAGLAVYSVVLCMGIGAAMVGIIYQTVEAFTG